jgi:hypothetical protein
MQQNRWAAGGGSPAVSMAAEQGINELEKFDRVSLSQQRLIKGGWR